MRRHFFPFRLLLLSLTSFNTQNKFIIQRSPMINTCIAGYQKHGLPWRDKYDLLPFLVTPLIMHLYLCPSQNPLSPTCINKSSECNKQKEFSCDLWEWKNLYVLKWIAETGRLKALNYWNKILFHKLTWLEHFFAVLYELELLSYLDHKAADDYDSFTEVTLFCDNYLNTSGCVPSFFLPKLACNKIPVGSVDYVY